MVNSNTKGELTVIEVNVAVIGILYTENKIKQTRGSARERAKLG